MATVSLTAFFIISITTFILLVTGASVMMKTHNELRAVSQRESEVNAYYADFLSGFKEIKMNSSRSFDLTLEMVNESKKVKDLKSHLLLSITNMFNFLQVLLYLVVGVMVFVVPIISDDFSTHVTAAATTALFLAASLNGIITSIPGLSESNISAQRLREIAVDLESAGDNQINSEEEDFNHVQSIGLLDVTYQHVSKSAKNRFVLGPVTYQFDAGKVYFIRGNNGSGKTTLMRVLTGLYQPTTGSVLVNGKEISMPSTKEYRDLFAVVFSDFSYSISCMELIH